MFHFNIVGLYKEILSRVGVRISFSVWAARGILTRCSSADAGHTCTHTHVHTLMYIH